MSQCVGIALGAEFDCENPPQGGVRQRLLLGNLSDVESFTNDVSNTYIIDTITMKTGKAMFAFEGVRNSLLPAYEFAPQTVGNGWDHIIDFSIFDVSAIQKENIEAMFAVEQFAIIENAKDSGNADNFFEVYGFSRGLVPITGRRAAADNDTGGAWVIQLKTGDQGGRESKTPSTFFITDLATTEAAIETLLTPAS